MLFRSKPKTQSGTREIPMSKPVYEAFRRVLGNHKDTGVVIDGYGNFLFCTRRGYPKTAISFEDTFHGLKEKYNRYHGEKLPEKFTPHTLRHTFCTKMACAGMNPKALQYIMGHNSINMTLNYYAHATYTSAREEMERLTS